MFCNVLYKLKFKEYIFIDDNLVFEIGEGFLVKKSLKGLVIWFDKLIDFFKLFSRIFL